MPIKLLIAATLVLGCAALVLRQSSPKLAYGPVQPPRQWITDFAATRAFVASLGTEAEAKVRAGSADCLPNTSFKCSRQAAGSFARAAGPCDLVSSGCASAWSVTRLMRAAYAGYLFQTTRASDDASQNIGVDSAGAVDLAALSNFCRQTTCVVSILYDQVGSNHLTQADARRRPALVIGDGQASPFIETTSTASAFLENLATSGLPTGSASKTIGIVQQASWSHCCGGFGLNENPIATDGGVSEPGEMFSIVFLSDRGTLFWFGADIEQGYAHGRLAQAPSGAFYGAIKYSHATGKVTALLNGQTVVNAVKPPYAINAGSRIALGSAGDKTPVAMRFHEGYISSAFTSPGEDWAVYVNQLKFYAEDGEGGANPWIQNCNTSLCPSFAGLRTRSYP